MAAAAGRAAAVLACAALAVVAALPFVFLRMPGARDGLRRLDRGSGLPHRPATAIADELAVTPKDPYSLALWNAHVERAREAARALRAGCRRRGWRGAILMRCAGWC